MGLLKKIFGLDKTPDIPFTSIDDENYETEVLGADKPVMFFVWMDTCSHCRKMAPNVKRAAAKHAGDIKVAQATASAAPGVMAKLGVRGVPVVFFFQNGEILETVNGFRPESYLDELIQAILQNDKSDDQSSPSTESD